MRAISALSYIKNIYINKGGKLGLQNKYVEFDNEDELSNLETKALEIGVHLELQPLENAFWISLIKRTTGRPGSGAEVLDMLKEHADDNGLSIYGVIVEGDDRLSDYYREQGFEVYLEKGLWKIDYQG